MGSKASIFVEYFEISSGLKINLFFFRFRLFYDDVYYHVVSSRTPFNPIFFFKKQFNPDDEKFVIPPAVHEKKKKKKKTSLRTICLVPRTLVLSVRVQEK